MSYGRMARAPPHGGLTSNSSGGSVVDPQPWRRESIDSHAGLPPKVKSNATYNTS